MADPAEPAGSNPCPACGFLNTPDRVYCEDCGAKLGIAPPSYLKTAPPVVPAPATPASTSAATPPTTPATAKKPRILSAQRGPTFFDRAWSVIRLLVYAALLAVLGAALWPPANIPPPATALDAETILQIRTRLNQTAERGSTVEAPWSRFNAYLASVLLPGGGSFVRAFLLPRPGGFTLTIQKRVLGLPIYTAVHYRLVVRDHRLSIEPTGTQVGRLPLPTAAAPVVRMLSGNLDTALAAELDILRRAQVVRLSPTDVLIDFGAHRP
jgi:hypothetical protein